MRWRWGQPAGAAATSGRVGPCGESGRIPIRDTGSIQKVLAHDSGYHHPSCLELYSFPLSSIILISQVNGDSISSL